MRLAGQAVQRDLDGDDRGVVRRLAQKLHEGVHALVGVGQKHLALGHLVDDAPVAVEARGPLGRERRVRERGAQLFGQTRAEAPRVAHIERHRGGVHLVRLQAEALEQKLLERARERPLAFQAHRGQTRALLEDALHVLAVVLVVLVGALSGVEVGVARDADDVGVLHGVHAEYLGGHHLDGVLEQDELHAFARQLDHALALARHGHEAERHALGAEVLRLVGFLGPFAFVGALGLCGLLLGGVAVLVEAHHHVQRAVLQMRERMARVDDLRREERHDVLVHVTGQKRALLVV